MISVTVYKDRNHKDQQQSIQQAVRNGASYIHITQKGSNLTRNYVNPDTVNKYGLYKQFNIKY